jgi:hypothetical protein
MAVRNSSILILLIPNKENRVNSPTRLRYAFKSGSKFVGIVGDVLKASFKILIILFNFFLSIQLKLVYT